MVGLACTPTPDEVTDPTAGEEASGDGSIPATCDNGMLDPGEECEDGNDDPLDGCLVDCSYGPSGLVTGMAFASPQYGNLEGGMSVADPCPRGEVLVGLRGITTAEGYVGRVQGYCGRLELAVLETGDFVIEVLDGEDLSAHGQGDGTEGISRCDPGQIAVGFGGRSGAVVDQVYLRCAQPYVSRGEVGWQLTFGAPNDAPAVGGGGGGPMPPTVCGEGFVATGLGLRVGGVIDAFGLECASLVLQVGP